MNALVARDRLRRDDALMARLVRQPRRSGDVADRPDALDICAAIGVGIDMALGRFDAELFPPDFLGVGQDAGRNDRVAVIMARALAVARLDARADSLVIGRGHVCTPVTNSPLVLPRPLEKKTQPLMV